MQLKAKQKAATKPKKEKAPPPPKADVPTDDQTDRLVWKINEVLAAKNLRPSPREIVRIAIAEGWGPTR
ncbi:hypothetical protein PX52LOC_05659 [Limnoglobus roseus]|uniref:Uncharacterized protein n=1 Tax=Limnoglobus roseus TaxID=2598579 RepID=A0A5C1AKT8_9BACT|nr:hypothetical protein PX52LOC_05659 [Limnoglobus roseus]